MPIEQNKAHEALEKMVEFLVFSEMETFLGLGYNRHEALRRAEEEVKAVTASVVFEAMQEAHDYALKNVPPSGYGVYTAN